MRKSNAFMLVLTILSGAFLAGCNMGRGELQVEPMRAYVDARSRLLEASDDEEDLVRMHALEALVVVDPKAAGPAIKQAMTDGASLPLVSAAVKAAGDIRYTPVKETLLAVMADPEAQPKLQCAAIYALHRMGDDTYTSRLGLLLRHSEATVRAEAAEMMGRMGERSAIGPLKSLQSDEHQINVKLTIAEALARLGDERAIGLLEAYTKDQFIDSQLIAVEGLGLLEHPRAVYVLRRTVHSKRVDPIVRVAAAKNLAKLGDDSGYGLAMDALADPEGTLRKTRGKRTQIPPKDANTLQVYAAQALANMDREEAVDALHPLLNSRRAPVRVASAQGIMQLLRAYKRSAPAPKPVTPKAAAGLDDDTPEAPVGKPPKLHTSGGKD